LTVGRSVRGSARFAMAADGKTSPNARRIATDAVRKKIREVIGKRVLAQDAGDIEQAAYLRLLAMPSLPETERELLGLVVVVVRGLVVDHHRRRSALDKRHDDGKDVDEVAPDVDDAGMSEREEWRRMLAFVEEEVAAGRISPDVLRWSKRLAEGDTLAQIAADEKIPRSTLKMRLHRAREHLRKHRAKYGAATGAVIALLLLLRRPEPGIVSHPRPRPSTAEEFRDEAARECSGGDFVECERDLDEAKRRDPTGDHLPYVEEMRRKIEQSKRQGD
jgi:DNA-directed RNA polymerase specialized sigma24 family protein